VSSEIDDASPVTSPGNSQIIAKEPKSSVSEAPSRTASKESESSVILADDRASFGFPSPIRGPGHLQRVYDKDQHDPIINDTQSPHVGPIVAPAQAQGVTRPSSRSDFPEGRPQPPRIATHLPLGGNLGGPRSACFTHEATGESGDSWTFDSAACIRVVFSGSDSDSLGGAGSTHRVVGVQPAVQRVTSKRSPSIQPLEPHRRKRANPGSGASPSSEMAGVKPKHGSSTLLYPPSKSSQGVLNSKGQEDPEGFMSGSSPSPFDESQGDAGPSKGILEAETPAIPISGHDSGSQPRSEFQSRGEGNDTGGGMEAAFPRRGIRRVVSEWGMSDGKRGENGKELGDHTQLPVPIEPVPLSNRVARRPRDQSLTLVSPTQCDMRYATQSVISVLI